MKIIEVEVQLPLLPINLIRLTSHIHPYEGQLDFFEIELCHFETELYRFEIANHSSEMENHRFYNAHYSR